MPKNEYPLNYVSKNLENILSEMVTEYSKELQEKAEKVTEEVAREFASDLEKVTPRSTRDEEHLADSIIVTEQEKKQYGRKGKVRYVHFKKWQISHLLEFGWTLRNGQKLVRTPFVRPCFDKNKQKYYRMYKRGLS